MKNSTLLVGLGLLAGCFAAEAQQTVRGIKISTDTEKYYYRISNMRTNRLNYSTGAVAGYDDITGEADWGDVYMVDNGAKQIPLPLFLHDGFPEDVIYKQQSYTDVLNLVQQGGEGDMTILLEDEGYENYKLTPQPYQNPYMGLVIYQDQFWCAFSAQDEIMNKDTSYWYFTSTDGSKVQIHNAVIEGTIKRAAGSNQPVRTMGFDTADNNYYVIPLKELFEAEGFDMSFNDDQLEHSFALSTSSSVTNTGTSCLDVCNFINYTITENQIDAATGEPVLNEETEEPIQVKYGFVGMERCWSPLRNNGANDNHLYNNGSTFFVDEADPAEAEAAIERYKAVVAETYRKGAVAAAKSEYLNVAQQMKGWLNVPALWVDNEALRAIIAECENYTTEATGVNNLATQEAFVAQAAKGAQQKLVNAAHIVGTGAIVTFQNLTAFRDLEAFQTMIDDDDEEEIAEVQPGNAYISAGIQGTYRNGTVEETDAYVGIGPKIVADANCEWELVPVAGDITFLLYNPATKTYIRKYVDMMELAGGEEEVGEEAYEFSWATTDDVTMAAPFQLVACANPEKDQEALTEAQEIMIEDYDVSTDITNNVRLETYNTVPQLDEEGQPVLNDLGEPAMVTTKYAIHRGSAGSAYKLINWNAPTVNNWFADSNVFHIGVIAQGSNINEINVDNVKAAGIYDLQGRKVAKAEKGLYIINGVKTIVR